MYNPKQVPTDPELLTFYLSDELRSISDEFVKGEADGISFNIIHNPIAKPRAGMVVMAAAGVLGTDEGIYSYTTAGAWVLSGGSGGTVGPMGPAGPTGATGPTGPAGDPSIYKSFSVAMAVALG